MATGYISKQKIQSEKKGVERRKGTGTWQGQALGKREQFTGQIVGKNGLGLGVVCRIHELQSYN